MMVIDLFGLEAEEVLTHFPEVYQHLLATVKEERRKQHERSPSLKMLLRVSWKSGGCMVSLQAELRSALSRSESLTLEQLKQCVAEPFFLRDEVYDARQQDYCNRVG